jgi:ribose transport system substrate-binding protein
MAVTACGGGDDEAAAPEATATEAASPDAATEEADTGEAAAAGTEGASADGPFKIAFFTDAQDNSYLQAAIAAAQEVADERGVDMDVIDATWDANKQLGQVQDAVSSGQYDALVVESVDGEVLCEDLTAAAEEMVVSIYNAPICGNYEDLYTDGTVGFFGPDNYQLGQLMGQEIAEALDGSGTVAYVSGPVQVGIVAATTDGLKDALAEFPDIELVSELDGGWDAAKGLAATQDIISSNPDIDGIVYGVDQMAVPSIEWLQESGNLGDIKIVTLGGSEEGFQLIKDGVIYASVNSLPREEAAYGLQAAIDTLEGKEINVPGWDAERKVYNTVEDPNVPGVVDASNVDSTPAEWGL